MGSKDDKEALRLIASFTTAFSEYLDTIPDYYPGCTKVWGNQSLQKLRKARNCIPSNIQEPPKPKGGKLGVDFDG